MRLQVTIPVEPVPKARARTIRTRTGAVFSYTPRRTAHAENLIRDWVMRLGHFFPSGTPIMIEATFYRQKPKTARKKETLPTSRPDIDNYFKLLTDALEKFIYHNDSQITTAIIMKRFGSPPRIELKIEEDRI